MQSNRVCVCLIIILVSFVSPSFAESEAEAEAEKFYLAKQWQESTSAYAALTSDNPENFRAWFRLANSHLKLKDGKQALIASQNAKASPYIPGFYIHYQQAQAYLLLDKETEMWESLDNAVLGGFSNLVVVDSNEIWQPIRNSERFLTVTTAMDKNANPCLHNDKYNQFDFWVGKWAVYGNVNKTGPLFGNNHVEKTENGCLIMEHWQGSAGTTGTSMNYYNGIDDRWVQNWVSAGGTTIDYEGGLVDGAMILQGKIYDINVPPSTAHTREFRGTWTSLKNGIVRQLFEESKDAGDTWIISFDGYYFPVEE